MVKKTKSQKKQKGGRKVMQGLGRGQRGSNAQVAGYNARPMNNRIYKESGSDYLGNLTFKAGSSIATASDRVLKSIPVTPSAIVGTRLAVLAGLYERYRFRKYNLRYVPAVPPTMACQVVVYQDTDPNDDPGVITDADALVRQAVAQAGSRQFNFVAPQTTPLSQRADDQLYYTGTEGSGDKRFSQQAVLHVIQITNPINFNGDPVSADLLGGSLFVDWECDFQTPQINPGSVVRSLGAPAPTEIFTKSSTRSTTVVGDGWNDLILQVGEPGVGELTLAEAEFSIVASDMLCTIRKGSDDSFVHLWEIAAPGTVKTDPFSLPAGEESLRLTFVAGTGTPTQPLNLALNVLSNSSTQTITLEDP
jgi:hypothetical protein